MSHSSAGSLRGGSLSPSISLQLVMHMLSPEEVLCFARSCKATLAAASCTFAWPHMVFFPPRNANGTMRVVTQIKERIDRSLLRFALKRGIHVNDNFGPPKTAETKQMIQDLILVPHVSVIRNNTSNYIFMSSVGGGLTHATLWDKITVYVQTSGSISLNFFQEILHRQRNLHTMDVAFYHHIEWTRQTFETHTSMTDLTIHCQWHGMKLDVCRVFPALVRFCLRVYDEDFSWKTIALPSTVEELCIPARAFPRGMWPELVRCFPSVRRFVFTEHGKSERMTETSLKELYQTLDAHPSMSVQLSVRMIDDGGGDDMLGCAAGVAPHARLTIG